MEKQYQWKDHVIFMGLLLGLAVWVNHGIQIKGLYMDDLYFWSCYGEQSFFEYVFPMGSTRFRFLYYLAAWFEMAVVRNHVALFVPINILLNAALSWYLYSIGWRLSRAKAIGFFTGAMFLASRMAYYQIGQVLGLMETMALWMAVSILWNLYRYINEENRENCFYFASLLYFGVCFVHERYMALLPLLLLALVVKKCKKISLWFSALISFGMVQLIRAFTIGSVLPAGTGGTQVADTLNIPQAIKFAFSQAAYVFGVNAGPEHLNGCPWSESPMWVKGLIAGADAVLLIMVLAFLVRFITEKQKEHRWVMLFNTLLFVGFIALNIASSSVTIRVEMRWIYVSLAGALLFLSYIYGELTQGVKKELYLKRLWPWGILFALMGISAARVDTSPASPARTRGLAVFLVQLAFNFFWSILFFNFQAFGAALVWLAILWLLIIWMIVEFAKVDKTAAWLQVPYLLWVSFAAYLNAGVWRLN